MDRFDPNFICNSSDTNGRYTYENQPTICKWNLLKDLLLTQGYFQLRWANMYLWVYNNVRLFYLDLNFYIFV